MTTCLIQISQHSVFQLSVGNSPHTKQPIYEKKPKMKSFSTVGLLLLGGFSLTAAINNGIPNAKTCDEFTASCKSICAGLNAVSLTDKQEDQKKKESVFYSWLRRLMKSPILQQTPTVEGCTGTVPTAATRCGCSINKSPPAQKGPQPKRDVAF